MENWWTIAGTLLGALIAGIAVLLNSVYSAKSTLKRENRNRLIEEKERDVKELENLYQDILHSLDKLIRGLGSLEKNELEKYYKMEIRLELISTKEIVDKLSKVSNDISKMVLELPSMPEEFIPKFEEDYERQSRLNARKNAKEKRKQKSKEFTPEIRKEYNKLSELMKIDLQKRRILDVDDYIEYRKKKLSTTMAISNCSRWLSKGIFLTFKKIKSKSENPYKQLAFSIGNPAACASCIPATTHSRTRCE